MCLHNPLQRTARLIHVLKSGVIIFFLLFNVQFYTQKVLHLSFLFEIYSQAIMSLRDGHDSYDSFYLYIFKYLMSKRWLITLLKSIIEEYCI